MKKVIAITALSLIALSAHAQINFRILRASQKNNPSVDKIINGIETFQKIVKRNCNIDIQVNIQDEGVISYTPKKFIFDKSLIERPVFDGKFPLQFYQFDLYKMLTTNDVERYNNDVVISVVDNMDAHCGFAFPKVQLEWAKESGSSEIYSKVESLMKRNVLVNSAQAGCGRFSRMLAHELGHIFIQDDPPHKCKIDGRLGQCPEDNLMSVFRYLRPKPSFGNGFPPSKPDHFDPVRPQRVPSIGTNLTSDQCQAIMRTMSF